MLIGIIDVETTGLDPENDELVEVAVARYDTELGMVDAGSCLIASDRDTTPGLEIHGIERELVERFGVKHVFQAPVPLTDTETLIAHNADFDRQWFPGMGKPWACTMDMDWPRKPHGGSLAALALAHCVGVVDAHRALPDVLTLVRVFDRARELGADLDAMIRRALRPKALFQAIVSFDDREKAKSAGFRWEPETKRWVKRCFVDDVATLGFDTRRLSE